MHRTETPASSIIVKLACVKLQIKVDLTKDCKTNTQISYWAGVDRSYCFEHNSVYLWVHTTMELVMK